MFFKRFKQLINWKLFFILWSASTLSIAAILPYVFALQHDVLSKTPFSMPVLVSLIMVQNSVLFAVVTATGLWFAKKVGFGLPILEYGLDNQAVSISWHRTMGWAVIAGISTGVVIVLIDYFFGRIGVQVPIESGSTMIWRGLLASFYGGIGEEVFMRLGLMSFLSWLLLKIVKPKNNGGIIWLAIIIVALLFGVGHLPLTASLTPLTPLIILRALVLNGIGGIVFGWLFWKRGLETAIVAHFSADIILHVVMPAVG